MLLKDVKKGMRLRDGYTGKKVTVTKKTKSSFFVKLDEKVNIKIGLDEIQPCEAYPNGGTIPRFASYDTMEVYSPEKYEPTT